MSSLALDATPLRRDPALPTTIGEGLPLSALTPVFSGLRIGLHALIAGLTGLVIVRTLLGAVPNPAAVVTLATLFLASYAGGTVLARRTSRRWVVPVWMAVLLVEWLALTMLAADAAFIVFPLFFLQLHVLPLRAGIPLVLLSVLLTVWSIGVQVGVSLGATLGPLVGAAVAVAVGLGSGRTSSTTCSAPAPSWRRRPGMRAPSPSGSGWPGRSTTPWRRASPASNCCCTLRS
jgi:hypothetical protein